MVWGRVVFLIVISVILRAPRAFARPSTADSTIHGLHGGEGSVQSIYTVTAQDEMDDDDLSNQVGYAHSSVERRFG
jgi:hypothetical protein